MVTMAERMSKFVNREPENAKERLIKALFDSDIVPVYTLSENGYVDSEVFLQTGMSKKAALDYIKQQFSGAVNLEKGYFATSNVKWPGFWVSVKEEEE